ncbi:MAG: TonB-dependent receptor [Polyangiaceae bacterium]
MGRGRSTWAVAVVLSTLAPEAAWGQTTPPPSRAPGPEALTPPVLRSRSQAVYPPDALRDGLEGTVGIELSIDENGLVTEGRVTAPAGHGFDEAAVAAARTFTFEPTRKAGKAIPSKVQFAYEFHRPPGPAPAPTAVAVSPPAPPGPLQPTSPPVQMGPDQTTLVVAQQPLGAPGPRSSASESTTGQAELSLHPMFRAEGMLEVVPGLFSVQHAGGGKAQQDFARGFNLDHGTDMAFFVDDVPINAVSHAHGQGYSDLHFLIPETVERVDSTKGTYAANIGDFGTAGSVNFRMADHTPESLAKLEIAPSTGHERFVVVESPNLGNEWRAVVAAEAFHENGPFIHPEDYFRLNAYAKVTRVIDNHSELSFMAMAYGGSWNMSGVLPARAVCGEGDGTPRPAAYSGSNCMSRWDSVDPTQGGAGQRIMAWAQYRSRFAPHWTLQANAYSLHSNLQLFPNDGIASSFQPDGIRYGSQIEQDDTRTESGANVALSHRAVVGGMPMHTTLGVQIRDDDIESQLHRTEARHRLDGVDANLPGPIYDGHINETELGAYIEEEVQPAPWLRLVLGAREDRVDAAVNNESQTAVDQVSGYQGQVQLSPKATAIVTPMDEWDLFVNTGRGFHTNDARTLFLGQAATLIASAIGSEVGTTVRPVPGLVLSAMGFLIDLTSELTIDGDTASTTPSGPTRRYGFETTGRYDFDDRLYADVSFTTAHSRYTDPAQVQAGTVFLPDAPIRTFSAGAGIRQPVGHGVTLVGSATVRSMSHRYGDSGPAPLIETGWTVIDVAVGVRWRPIEIVADLFNVADVKWREGQFEVASRLPLEGANPPPGISFTPGLPRTLMVHGAVHW